MGRAHLLAGLTVLALISPSTARAALFRLGGWEGALEGVVDFSRQDTRTSGSPTTTFKNLHGEERLTVRNAGAYVYDPRLLTISAGGTFGLAQEDFTAGEETTFRTGELSGYDLFAGLRPGRPFSMNLFATRLQSFPPLLGGTSEILSENRGATLFAWRLLIPSTVTLRAELAKEETTSGDVTARQESKRKIATYEGQRGWTNGEMGIRYEFIDDADQVFPDLSFRSHDGNLSTSLDFGPELNWRWDTRLRYFDRQGVTDITSFTVATADEYLRVDHTDRLRTEYRYFFAHTATPGGTTNSHTAAANLRHRLYQSLTTLAGFDSILQTFPDGKKQTLRSRLDLSYTKRLPREGRLDARLGGGFEYEDDQFHESESFVPHETHTVAAPFALSISLDNPFAVASSLVVTKISLGPLPPGCVSPPGPPTPLVLGRDYTLRTAGDVTEIVPLPCAGTAPGINPGDEIAVDYRFAVPRALSFTTAIWRLNVGVDYGWIRPYFAHEQTEQTLQSGRDEQFLDDRLSDTVGIELRYERPSLRASLLGEAQWFDSDRLTFNSVRSAQFASLTILPAMTLNLNSDEMHAEFEDPARRTDTFTGRLSLTYTFGATLFADASGSFRVLADTLFPTEQVTEAAFRLRWRVGQFEANPALEFFDRQRGDTDTREIRATFRTVRRF